MIDFLFGTEGRDFVDDELIAVRLAAADRAELLDAGFRVLLEQPLPGLGENLIILAVPAGLGSEDGLGIARGLAPDALIDLNHLYGPGGAGCPGEACWGARLVGMTPLPETACVRGAPIAVIDTAVDSSRPAFAEARIETRSFLRPATPAGSRAHGTAIAALLVGTVAPEARPLAPGASLLAAEVFGVDDDGGLIADAAAILQAIDWAMTRRARVIALSLAGPPNALLRIGTLGAATRANLVAAAGNDGPGGEAAYPAAWPEVMAVAAVDRRSRPYRQGTRGDYVEIAAPGVEVLSIAAEGGRQAWTGSSFAVPFVAAALLRARAETGGDPEAARQRLARGARDLGAPGRDPIFGYGLLANPGDRCW